MFQDLSRRSIETGFWRSQIYYGILKDAVVEKNNNVAISRMINSKNACKRYKYWKKRGGQ